VSPGVARRPLRLKWSDRACALEAVLAVTLARVAIQVLPFRVVMRLTGWPMPVRPVEHDPSVTVRRVRWAVEGVSRRLPFEVVCFPKGLAAHVMLRRRGIPATLFYGAAPTDKGLEAHVWVRVGDIDVIGTETADRFATIARFPADNVDGR